MKQYLRAFSLAEMMVVMLLMCLVIVAVAPVITKRAKDVQSKKPSVVVPTNVQAGMIFAYYGEENTLAKDSGWLLCDGKSYPTTGTYANLFKAIGYTYGGSGGSFNVPNLGGYFVRGLDTRESDAVDQYYLESAYQVQEGEYCNWERDIDYSGGSPMYVDKYVCYPNMVLKYNKRPLGSIQDSANKKHYHGLYSTNGAGANGWSGARPRGWSNKRIAGFGYKYQGDSARGIQGDRFYTENMSSYSWYYYKDGRGNKLTTTGKDNNTNTTSTDAPDAHPKNFAVNYIIRAE